jgi:anaerobic magnesium-protoporphyrin IX monomethyl ester cyclase
MVDILLIQPPIYDFYLTAKRTVPYGLACIAAGLIEAGFSVEILDALATSKSRVLPLPPEMSYLQPYYGRSDRSPFALFHDYKHYGCRFDALGQQVKRAQPFLVGISSLFTAYAAEAVKTAQIVKAYQPQCITVLGGHHPTALPERVMESAAVDFVVRGEGERPMALLARALRNGTDYRDIPGLVFRQPDGRLHVGDPAVMADPAGYPLPAIELLDWRYYRRGKKVSTTVVASRGCPLNCSYCSVGASSASIYRRRSVESVIDEIENAVKQHAVGFIDFEDENLALNREWFLALLDAITRRFKGYSLELRAMNGLLPCSLDGPVIGAMKTAGFNILNLSLGTTAAGQLKRFRRPDVVDAFEQALASAEAYDLEAVGYIIVGAPFQKPDDSLADLIYLAQQRVLIGTSVFYPAPGSADYTVCAAMGLLPENFACMRSSALPLSHATTRQESITLLRLSRIINFMKSLIDSGRPIPTPAPASRNLPLVKNRQAAGIKLLQYFLHDGRIRGISPQGDVFEHEISLKLSQKFLAALKPIHIRGCQKRC